MAAGLPVAGESPGRGVCVFGGAGEGRDAEVDGFGLPGAPVDLGELVAGLGEADLSPSISPSQPSRSAWRCGR